MYTYHVCRIHFRTMPSPFCLLYVKRECFRVIGEIALCIKSVRANMKTKFRQNEMASLSHMAHGNLLLSGMFYSEFAAIF